MKKLKLLFSVVLILLISVSCDKYEGVLSSTNNTSLDGLKSKHKVVVIEDCEYIVYTVHKGYSGVGYMAHKGNCSNSIHKCN